jgi:hypothetical protein
LIKYPITVDPEFYAMLKSLLAQGIVSNDGKIVDFSEVQNIKIEGGTMTFNPPAKISADFGLVKIRTTVSSLKVQKNGIKIDINNSPVNLELRPK